MSQAIDHTFPENEQQRLEAVRRYDVLDTPADGAFDRITRLASTILDMPISIVSLVDHDRIWFKPIPARSRTRSSPASSASAFTPGLRFGRQTATASARSV
jgi:uncharacterized protein (DUF2342 family)